ncbi:hypothetical protein SFD26_004005 [Salmonella enterica subsp. enterica serovar Infantis]|nr:hypothetical protein [Salmonella enterica subsp. enterica serovar Infantis]EMB9503514.1 hypothetical protein [Salmonella enterica subsp. enterica serovar Infantis]EMC5846729.1 hypothetical protein [Salmonella enterica subsp. enterica serovar Infantis]EMC9315630.1 hypothetical protein [Salmonella enterica subsp. enterica serovar Infantis]
MGKQYKVISKKELFDHVAQRTKDYNDSYEDEHITYFQALDSNPEKMIKEIKTNTKYTPDNTVGDLILDLGDKQLDITNFTECQFRSLSDDLSHELASQEIIDVIKTYPALKDLNDKLSVGEISVDTKNEYASVKDSNGELLFSIESSYGADSPLTKNDEFEIISWNENDGVYHNSISEGLKAVQKNILSKEYKDSLEIDEPEQKSRSSYRA